MAAPKGNQFWKLRSKHGREKLFASAELLWEAACEYFQWCESNPFKETEQVKTSAKAFWDNAKGQYVFPPNTIELPKMRPFTIYGLCSYLGCNSKYFNDFKAALKDTAEKTEEQKLKCKDFSEVVTRIEETIYNQKFSGAASGFLNANIIARDLGLKERTDITTDDEKLPQTVIKWGDKEIKV